MKAYFIFLFLFILLFMSICGCINNNSNNNKIDSLDIHISNGTNRTYNITLVLKDDINHEILNETFNIKSNGQKDFKDITDKIGQYVIEVYLDDNRYQVEDNIAVNEYRHTVSVHIDYDIIKIVQKVE